jgi:GWxTD domain-containing protein
MRIRDCVAVTVAAALFCAGRSEAAISARSDDFLRGPAQWHLTNDEVRALRSAASDEEAQKAIALFWVRRDPTPGTPRNEFHEEFDARVAFADREFKFRNKRGSLTDQGKVYILLGPAKDFSKYAGHGAVGGAVDETGWDRGIGGRFEWTYPQGTGIGLSGPVIFIENMNTGEYNYDIQHSNVGGALGRAREKAVVSAGLTVVPAWAVEQPAMSELTIPDLAAAETSTAPAPSVVPHDPGPSRTVAAPHVAVPLLPAGVRTLVLMKDVMAIHPREGGDPLARAASAVSFTMQDDLGYAFRYCSGSLDPATHPVLGLTLTISGESEGKKVHFSGADDDLVPDGIPTLPGCYLVRGSLPLGDVGRGSYELALTLTDKASHQTYNLRKSFKVE